MVLDNGMMAHVNSIQEMRLLDLGDARIDHVSLVQVTKQEMDVDQILTHDKTELGQTHEAPTTLQ